MFVLPGASARGRMPQTHIVLCAPCIAGEERSYDLGKGFASKSGTTNNYAAETLT
jgi:hypothetical protein